MITTEQSDRTTEVVAASLRAVADRQARGFFLGYLAARLTDQNSLRLLERGE